MSVVLDSSALLALLRGERGADVVAGHARGALILTVNVAEVVQRMLELNVAPEIVLAEQARLDIVSVPFSVNHAVIAAKLRKPTKEKGLALGDRACLALALERCLPVLTADDDWLAVETGADIRLIRERRDRG